MPDFTFRVQALGGKFLADDIGGARVTVYDAETGVFLAGGVTRGNSGTLVGPAPSEPPDPPTPDQIVLASKSVLTQDKGKSVWWLVADPGSSAFVAPIEVEAPRRVRVKVDGPVGGLQSAASVEALLTLVPGGAPPPLPGHVILLPGLLVQPLSPQIHTQVGPGALDFTAKVTMMCGCQVAQGGYWPSSDFEVVALVKKIAGLGHDSSTCEMGLLVGEGQPASTFSTSVKVSHFNVLPPGSGTSFYQATICARQKSTGNSGSATINFFCVGT